ncbi:hypothetical protein ACRRTK_009700 [Alexandromys fortis]
MIDLSFLTEEEQDAILKVLQRDAALKRTEEERVRHLPEKIKDDQQLKNMSGQWFYEAKAKRHRDRIHGADIIRASMRKKRLPVAAEQSKDTAMRAKESWVNNVNKDALLPPELAAVEEPEDDTAPAGPRVSGSYKLALEEDGVEPVSGTTHLRIDRKSDELSKSKEKTYIPDDISSQKVEKPKQPLSLAPENGSQIKPPIPKARKLLYKPKDLKIDDNQSFPRQRRDSLNAKGAPRGILKRNSSSSSTDSETLRLNYSFDSKSRSLAPGLTIHERISEKEPSLEDNSPTNSLEPFKHVRFSAVKDELPQGPRPVLGQEVGEFTVLESDSLQNGTEYAGGLDKFQDHQKPSHRKPLSPYQSASSPSVSERETHQQMSFGSLPSDRFPCHSDFQPTRPQPVENSPIINDYQDKSPSLTRRESELSKSPADELTPCAAPEPSQTSDHSFRDHQQGKPLLLALGAQTSSRLGPCATETRKTTDDSISKVLDWFNRSSHTEGSMSSLQHLQGLDPRQQTDSESQITVPLMMDNTCVKGDSKILPSTKIKWKPVRSDSTFQEEKHVPVSEACQDTDALLKSNSANRSQQGTPKEGPDTLQPFERYRIPSQRSISMVCSHSSESTGEGCGTVTPNSSYLLSALKRSEAEPQVPWNPKLTGSLGKEEPKFHVPQKSKGNTHVNVGISAIVLDYNSKDDLEGQSKTRNTSILKPSLKPENGELPLGAADSGSSWRKPEGHEEADESPQNQVLRETYKSVSDRISFWEGEKAGAKIKAKEPTPSCSQEPSSAKAHKPAKSQVMFTGSSTPGQSEYGQVTGKAVVLDEDDQTPHLSSFYPSNKPKTTRPPTSCASKTYSSADQSDKVSPLHTTGDEICHSLEKDRFVIDQSNASFKVLSLKERMDEPNTERAYHHSQFENLRKFWGLGANLNNTDNDETNTSAHTQKSMPFDSQKSKESDSMKSSRENTHEEEGRHLRQGHITAAEEMETSKSKGIFQAPPDETAVPRKPPRKFTYHSAGNEPSKENVGKNMGCFVAPVTEETRDCSDQEIQESIVKTSIVPPVSKDMFNHRLQKLLAEGAVLATQTSGRSVQEQKALYIGVSETGSHKAGFNEDKEDVPGPKKTLKECVDEVVAPPQVQQSSSVDQLLKEAARSSSTPLPSPLELATARPNPPPKDDQLFERWIERKHSPSGDQRGLIAPSPQGVETSGDTALTQKAECWNPEGEPQPAAERSFPPAHPSCFFERVSSSSADVSLTRNTRLVSQDGTLPSQGEISEAIEQVVLLSRPTEMNVNAVLQKLLREAGEVKITLPERVQTADRPSSPQRVSPPWTAMDAVPDTDFCSFYTAPDTVHEGGSYLSAGMSPSEHLVRSPVSVVTQQVLEPLQEVVETVRETLIQPKSECLEFRAGLEKLLKETLESSLSKEEKDPETISPSAVTGRCEMSQQLASEFCPKEIQETVEKAEAPLVTQSAFDDGFEKLLKEMSEGPCQLKMSAKEDTKKQPSQAEQDRFLGEIPHLNQNAPGTSKMEVKCKGLESELNLGDKLLGGDEAVIGPSVDVRGYPHGFGVPERSQLYGDYEIETVEMVQSVGDRGRERAVTESTWTPQEPDFEEAPEEVIVSRNMQPIALLGSTGKPTAMSKAESILAIPRKRQEKERRLEASSESEFSDGNTSSNGESWRNTSSEEEHSPVLRALGRSAARTMPSKSLDDISSDSASENKVCPLSMSHPSLRTLVRSSVASLHAGMHRPPHPHPHPSAGATRLD